MFDNINNQTTSGLPKTAAANTKPMPAAPAQPASTAQDIFAETEKPAKPEILKPKKDDPVKRAEEIARQQAEFKQESKKYLIFGIIILAAALIFIGSFWGLKRFFYTKVAEPILPI